jgi:predicted MFS family arabinose efflux permease
VQGTGAGGVASLCHIILSDLVPLRDRGVFNGLIAIAYTVANAVGPVIGGALAQNGQWRWIFYLNVPISCVTAGLVLLFLNLRTPSGSLGEKLQKIDWIGNALVVASTTSTMIGLTWGGVQAPWASARILVPLITGIVGLIAFLVYEAKIPQNPLVPFSLMSTPTALSGYCQTFILFTVTICILYYFPVYFQACMDASPIASGVDIFGLAFTIAPSAIIVGLTIARSHSYRPQIWLSWCLVVIGVALFSTLGVNGSNDRGKAIGYQVIEGSGIGMLTAAVFFPFLAPIPVESNAHAIALYTFIRNFANILGITIGGVILQNELGKRLPSDFASRFPEGVSIAYSIIPLIRTLPEPLKGQIQIAFADSLKVVWQALAGIAGGGLVVSLAMKGLKLHSEVDAKWGLNENSVESDLEASKEGRMVESRS